MSKDAPLGDIRNAPCQGAGTLPVFLALITRWCCRTASVRRHSRWASRLRGERSGCGHRHAGAASLVGRLQVDGGTDSPVVIASRIIDDLADVPAAVRPADQE